MTNPTSSSDRSVHVGGSVTGSTIVTVNGSVITTGDSNTVSVQFQQAALPEPETVDIKAELAALKAVLAQLQSEDQRKINNALEDAEIELAKSEPDKDEVGQALDRALNYAEKASGFAAAIDNLRPHVEAAAGWLGKHGYKLLPLVGLAL